MTAGSRHFVVGALALVGVGIVTRADGGEVTASTPIGHARAQSRPGVPDAIRDAFEQLRKAERDESVLEAARRTVWTQLVDWLASRPPTESLSSAIDALTDLTAQQIGPWGWGSREIVDADPHSLLFHQCSWRAEGREVLVLSMSVPRGAQRRYGQTLGPILVVRSASEVRVTSLAEHFNDPDDTLGVVGCAMMIDPSPGQAMPDILMGTVLRARGWSVVIGQLHCVGVDANSCKSLYGYDSSQVVMVEFFKSPPGFSVLSREQIDVSPDDRYQVRAGEKPRWVTGQPPKPRAAEGDQP